MIFLKKYMEIWYFLQIFWNDNFSKKNCTGIWSFLYYLERWNLFYPKNVIFFFLRNTWKYDTFFNIFINVTNMILLSYQKNLRRFSPKKVHLKAINILDWHSRKSSSHLLYFMKSFIGVFIYYFSLKKKTKKNKQETYYIGLKVDFFFNLFGWRYSTDESSILCTIQSSRVVFWGVLERQLRKLFVH